MALMLSIMSAQLLCQWCRLGSLHRRSNIHTKRSYRSCSHCTGTETSRPDGEPRRILLGSITFELFQEYCLAIRGLMVSEFQRLKKVGRRMGDGSHYGIFCWVDPMHNSQPTNTCGSTESSQLVAA